MSDLHIQIGAFIFMEKLARPGERLLVGVSGGADSVVLLHLLRMLGFSLVAAHVNYHLRGEESDADEAFVRALCQTLRIPLYVTGYDTLSLAASKKGSIESIARHLRYQYFLETARAEDIRTVAVAHHQDDQAETVLLQLIRGSGPEGLAGMRPSRRLARDADVRLIRPLLKTPRKDLLAWARSEGISWREDSSNTDLSYRRNGIRRVVLPALEQQCGPGVAAGIAHSAELMRKYAAHEFRTYLFERFRLCTAPAAHTLSVTALEKEPAVWRRRILIEATRRFWGTTVSERTLSARLEQLIEAQPGRHVDTRFGQAWRDRDVIRFIGVRNDTEPMVQSLAPETTLVTETGSLVLKLLPAAPDSLDPGTPNVAYVDADRLTMPLSVRRWLPGDRLRPLNLHGTKKVSDLLTDAHVPPSRKKSVHVILSGTEIVWVPGIRLADAFSVKATTARFAKILFIPAGNGS